MNDDGFIKLHRKMLKWEWYDDINTKVLFIHLLLIANWEDKKWRGMVIKRGQVIAGRKKLSKETGLTEQQVRTSLSKLISTNNITNKTTNKYTVITIKNYDLYQQYNQQVTNNQPSNNQQVTTTKEIKEIKEIYNNNNISVYVEKQFGRILSATEKEEITKWSDTELTKYAINQAVLCGKGNVKYISKIIEAYGRENIETVQQAQQRERKYAEAKKKKEEIKKNRYQRNTKTMEPEPDWLNIKIEKKEMTPEEKAEIEELLKKFKEN